MIHDVYLPQLLLLAALTHVFCMCPLKVGVRLGVDGLADIPTTLSSNILLWIISLLYEPIGNLCSLTL